MKNLLSGSYGSLSKKASYLRIASGVLAESLQSGGFKSLYRGQGVEFSGVREYLRGDDIRSIDWNVTARMGKPFVKLFEEERELQMFLIVDRSASMFTGSKGRVKYEAAADAAAVLTVAAELTGSSVGAVFFDGEIHFSCVPGAGRKQTMLLLSRLDEAEFRRNGSVLDGAITGAVKMLRKRSLVFIVSDFRTTGWEEPFKLLAQRHDVTAVRITDPSEIELPEIGAVPFTDIETGQRTVLATRNPAFKAAWREGFRRRIQKLNDFCVRHGADFVSISTDEDCVRMLSRFFAAKGQSGR